MQEPESSVDLTSLSAAEFFEAYVRPDYGGVTLDGADYPVIDTESIPAGYAEVDMKLNDHGVITECAFLSGVDGRRVSDSKDTKAGKLSGGGLRDVVSPVVGWFMYEKMPG
jgi:hypothetical protein